MEINIKIKKIISREGLVIILLALLVSGCATTGSNIRYYDDHAELQWLKDDSARFRTALKEF
ncbi:MAG: hypothetical protein V1682_04615, partial [Candidatus Omnitrophota bacterium]